MSHRLIFISALVILIQIYSSINYFGLVFNLERGQGFLASEWEKRCSENRFLFTCLSGFHRVWPKSEDTHSSLLKA